ncbi:MAG: hypothetical protein AAGF32_03315, partial [Pseudomonadota bacterium]
MLHAPYPKRGALGLLAPCLVVCLSCLVLASGPLTSRGMAQDSTTDGWTVTAPAGTAAAPAQNAGPSGNATGDAAAATTVGTGFTSSVDRAVGNAQFRALLTAEGPELGDNVIWRVFVAADLQKNPPRPLHERRAGTMIVSLEPGKYLVSAAYGRAHTNKVVTVREAGDPITEVLVLNAGGMRLDATTSSGLPVPDRLLSYDIFTQEQDQFGQRQLVLGGARASLIMRLNADFYHVVARYGRANATIEADVSVEPGRITQINAQFEAARVTFKLVETPGGESLPGTAWRIEELESGALAATDVGALPSHILATGEYRVLATRGQDQFSQTFTVNAGEEGREIEVLA